MGQSRHKAKKEPQMIGFSRLKKKGSSINRMWTHYE